MAVKILSEFLQKDDELYYGYQSNIAVAFQDEFARSPFDYKNRKEVHRISNEAAKNFLNNLIRPISE